VEEFQKLHEAKEILTDEKKRKCYDLWLRSRITIPFSQWQALSDSVKTVSVSPADINIALFHVTGILQ